MGTTSPAKAKRVPATCRSSAGFRRQDEAEPRNQPAGRDGAVRRHGDVVCAGRQDDGRAALVEKCKTVRGDERALRGRGEAAGARQFDAR